MRIARTAKVLYTTKYILERLIHVRSRPLRPHRRPARRAAVGAGPDARFAGRIAGPERGAGPVGLPRRGVARNRDRPRSRRNDGPDPDRTRGAHAGRVGAGDRG